MQLNSAIEKIIKAPAVTFALVGAPGCGKTTGVITSLKKLGREVLRVDCANVCPEDLARLPVLSKDKKTMHFAIPDIFSPRGNVAIVLDELFKAPDDVLNALLPLIHGKQMFGEQWPDDTIVVITANSADFRVGDKLQPHALNRVVKIDISDHTPQEAEALMLNLGFDARIIKWTQQVPTSLVSYCAATAAKPDSENGFYFGYSPRTPREPFCSLRSLHTASMLMQAGITDSDTLSGAIGKKAAASLALYCKEIRSYVQPANILNGTAQVPGNMFDERLAACTAVAIMTTDNWEICLNYIERLHPEVQAVAFRAAARKSSLKDLALERRWQKFVAKNS